MQETKGKSSFNSTTVQLIRTEKVAAEIKTMFQFHNGTINTNPTP